MKPLKDFEPFLSQLLLKMAKETHFSSESSLAEVLEKNPRLVVAFNHASPLSWLPAIALLTAHTCARGGGNRRPMGVMDKFFFAVPGFRTIAQQLTQSDRPLAFEELVERFKTKAGTDIVLFPEGSNCFFGNPENLQPFRSPRFVELAIRTQTPILLCAHRGSENWAVTLPVPEEVLGLIDLLPKFASDFLGARLKQTGAFALPLLPLPMDRFEMHCELYHPTLREEELSEEDEVCREQVRAEADQVHKKLQSMLDVLAHSTPETRSSVASSRMS